MEKIYQIISCSAYKLVLDIVSYYVICPVFTVYAFKLDLSTDKIIESYVLLILTALLVQVDKKKISTVIIWLFISVSYIPTLTIYSLGNESRYWVYATTLFWWLVLLLTRVKSVNLVKYKLNKPITIRKIISGIVLFCAIASIFSSPSKRFTLDFTEVYESRADFKPSFPMADYFLSWSLFVVNPLLIGLYSSQKKFNLMWIFCGVQFLFFGFTGHKVVLFSVPLLLGFSFLIKTKFFSLTFMNIIISLLLCMGFLSWNLWNDPWILAIVGMRLLILPAATCYYYYDFFSQNTPTYLSHSIFSSFIQYPYKVMPWFIIGENYFNKDTLVANTGLVADAYMNFRETGLVIVAILFSICLLAVDNFAKRFDSKIVISTTTMGFAWSLNGSFFSSILTGGLAIAFILILTLPRNFLSANSKSGLRST